MSTRSLHTALGATLAMCSCVHAQLQAGDLPEVEQGTTDVNPLASQQMVLPLDLQVPNDFQTLHEVRGPDGSLQYVRFAGGTAAVFPRSVYLPVDGGGYLPDIPPNTIFYIDGLPPSSFAPPDAAALMRRSPNMVDHRVMPMLPRARQPAREPEVAEVEQVESEPLPRPTTVWLGDDYRRHRVSKLLQDAAAARQSFGES